MGAIDDLTGEHKAVLLALDLLERVTHSVLAGHKNAQVHLAELLGFFSGFVDRCHHGKEEEVLFPALERWGDEQTRPLIVLLREEHEEGRRHVRAITGLLERLREGESKAAEQIGQHAQAYAATLRAHIDREDHTLFPKARILMSAEEGDRLVRQFDAIERERVGPGVHEAFHALLHRLRAAYPA